MKNWIQESFFRTLTDFHIPNFEGALDKFDPERYADSIKRSGATTTYVAAANCLGLCFYPTKTGLRHKAAERDVFGATLKACHDRGIRVICYMNSWGTFVCDKHPDWNVINSKGVSKRDTTRYGNPCPNNPEFRTYINNIVTELVSGYDIDGLWVDMNGIFSPVCYCKSCEEKYRRLTGKELPRVLDFDDPDLHTYFRFKHDSVTEHVAMMRATALAIKPDITVTFQCAQLNDPFRHGHNGVKFYDQCDYLAGDFYTGRDGINTVSRLLYRLSDTLPFEYMISRCSGVLDAHTMNKDMGEITRQAFCAYMQKGAFVLIDAIDPDGGFNEAYYAEISGLAETLAPYLPHIDYQEKALREIAVYYSIDSAARNDEHVGKGIDDIRTGQLLKRLENISHALGRAHLDFDVLTKRSLDALGEYKVLILPDAEMLGDEEIEAIRAFVKAGGCAYISGKSSIKDGEGRVQADFRLADVLGLKFEETFALYPSYLAPVDKHQALFGKYTAKHPHMIKERMVKATPTAGETLATVTLPISIPSDHLHFSSAISDPPMTATASPAIHENTFGKGRVIWCAGRLENDPIPDNMTLFTDLVLRLLGEPQVKLDAPECVEHVLYAGEDCWKLNLLNHQEISPAIPIHGMSATIDVGERRVKSVRTVSGTDVNFAQDGSKLSIKLNLALFELLLINFE